MNPCSWDDEKSNRNPCSWYDEKNDRSPCSWNDAKSNRNLCSWDDVKTNTGPMQLEQPEQQQRSVQNAEPPKPTFYFTVVINIDDD
jgi:hypothetical protein